MADQDWSMKGQWLKNCNCAYGCPCDFNARPTHGHCEGMVGMRIESGHFENIDLSGLHWAAVYHWPGALHEGNGTMQPVIDERADEKQRAALLTILSGLEQNDGTFLHIVSMIVTEVLEPQFVPMEFEFDLEKLLYQNCQINIVHNKTESGTYGNVKSVVPAAKGVKPLKIEDYVRMCERPDWKPPKRETVDRHEEVPGNDPREDDEGDIPF